MKTAANQKIIRISKASTDKENHYGIVNKNCMYKASQNLGYNEFKIYMYLATNQDGHEFALSPIDIAENMGANKREIQKNINSLIKKGYLMPDSGNRYIFRENITEEYNSAQCSPTSQIGVETPQCGNTTVWKNNIETCGNPTHKRVEKQHRNNTLILHNNIINNYAADAANERANEQDNEIYSEQTEQGVNTDTFKNINDIPHDIVQKVIVMYQDGYKYNKENQQIQKETGLSGRIIFQIINDFKNGNLKFNNATDDILDFGVNGYISVETIKNAIKEKNISEYDTEALFGIYKEYYEVSMDYSEKGYIDKQIVVNWFEKKFDYKGGD